LQRRHELGRPLPAPECEQRERRRVAADGRLCLGRIEPERPLRLVGPGASGEELRLDHADRPAPRGRGRVLPALAPAERRTIEPGRRLVAVPEHQQGEPRAVGRFPAPHGLRRIEPRLPVLVAATLPLEVVLEPHVAGCSAYRDPVGRPALIALLLVALAGCGSRAVTTTTTSPAKAQK